jgi:hypothetical protein
MARRYDSSTTTFSPEGRLHQVRLNDSKCLSHQPWNGMEWNEIS